ncbi:MAG: amidohydrolase family protein [Pseudoxanthomonas sp.]
MAPAWAGHVLIAPERVWTGDGDTAHTGWVVLVRDEVIEAVGPAAQVPVPADARRIELPGTTLLPGLIDLHSHLLLHPYNEAVWNDQVLKEPQDYRTLLAARHAEATLRAGYTFLRDLGSEGAGYADVSIKRAIDEGLIPGPRLQVATLAIVAASSYGPGPKGFRPDLELPQGAQPVSGVAEGLRAVREQASRGAEWIKLYGDYRLGPAGEVMPAFTDEELHAMVGLAHQLGRKVAVHASSDAAVRQSVQAGADTIEHGYAISDATFALMKKHGTVWLPTLTAVEASAEYAGGYQRGQAELPARMQQVADAFARARKAGVTIADGSDVGVFAHGDNWREPEWLVRLGMSPAQALHAATDVAAAALAGQPKVGRIAPGMLADLAGFAGNPDQDITALRRPVFVMKGGAVVREDDAAK